MLHVGDLPPEMQTSGKIAYSFAAEHDPLENNYGHSELRVYKDGQRAQKTINSKIKKKYRMKLAFQCRVIVQPVV